ncbi:LysR family transcriptional regulator [Gephyromycinifex aptenodytis]|uniref:LysR family transcriptional regulator n=1 Tax=Gephyromycinifex aptenodytis TaxID=2716227 RepID=UPI001444C8BC|nr:LysR family transcriptional regulator [Gephyromycinifex aptenodytis]
MTERKAQPDIAALALLSAIAERGSLGAAARSLQMAQPNASRLLARLESDLRLRLVERSPRGSRLTAAGQLVAEWADPVLGSLDRLVAGAASLREDVASHLLVGASLTIGEYLAPRWLTSFRQSYPHVQVRLRVLNSADVVAAVRGTELDLGFVESPNSPADLHSVVVAYDELVLIVAPDHPWTTRRDPVSVAELADTPLVVREPGSGTRRTVEAVMQGYEVATPLMELSNTGSIVHSVAGGLGPAIVSTFAVEVARRQNLVAVVPLAGPPLRRRLRAIWRSTPALRGPAGDFVSHVTHLRR